MRLLDRPSISVILFVVLIIVHVGVMVVPCLVSVHISWAVVVIVGLSMVVEVSLEVVVRSMLICVHCFTVTSVVRCFMGWSIVVVSVSWSVVDDWEVVVDFDVVVSMLCFLVQIFWVLWGMGSLVSCGDLVSNLMNSLESCFMGSLMSRLVSNFVRCLVDGLVDCFW